MDALGIGDEGTINLPLGFAFPLPGGGSTTSVDACPDGYVWLNGYSGATLASDYTPSVTELLSEPPRIFAHWADLQCVYPPYHGDIWFNTFAASGSTPARAVITFMETPYHDGVTVVRMQLQLYDNGVFSLYYGDAGLDGIVGVTPGFGANDPGPADLSAGVTGGGSTIYQQFTAPATSDLQDHLLVFNPNTGGGYDVSSVVVPVTLAESVTRGVGCPNTPLRMMYQDFTAASPWDIPPMTSIRYSWIGDRYIASQTAYTWESNVANNLGIGDDAYSAALPLGFTTSVWGGSVSSILVNSNGRVHFDVATAASNLPIRTVAAIAGYLYNGPVLAVAGVDFDPTSGGAVYYDTFASPPRAVVTWQNVPRWNTPSETATVQAQIFPSGDLLVSYQSFSITQDGNIGLFLGDGTPAQGPIDYTMDLPAIAALDRDDAQLVTGLPILGQTFAVHAENLQPTVLATVGMFGLPTNAPLDFLGMTGCSAYTLGELLVTPMVTTGTGATLPLTVPTMTSLVGASFTGQAFAIAPGVNALGIQSTNGVDLTIGH